MVIKPEEKRRFPRIKLRTPIHWRVRGLPESDNGICDNVSIGGASFICNRFVAPETSMMLEINVLSRILHPVAKVTWANPLPHSDRNTVGVEFVELDPREKNYLNDFITMQLE